MKTGKRLISLALCFIFVMTALLGCQGETTTEPTAALTPTAIENPDTSPSPGESAATPSPTAEPLPSREPVYSSQEDKSASSETFSCTIEAEDGVLAGNLSVSTSRSGYKGTGYVTGFNQTEGNSWTYEVEIPYSQHYKITVRAGADQHKENLLLVNGQNVGNIVCNGHKKFVLREFDGIYLEAGTAVFSIQESWGWFDLDSITIETSAAISSDYYNGVSSVLANPAANEKTVKIMEYLVSIYGKHTLAGQYCAHNSSNEINTIYEATGKYPAIRGFDMIFCSPNSGWSNISEVSLAMDWAEKGGLVTFSWHWHGPVGNHEFYTSGTNFRISQAKSDLDLTLMPLSEIKELYEAGTISEETYRLYFDIDTISTHLNRLQEAGVTVLWRPLHEASGGWFWWGASGASDYIWLWKEMFNRQTYLHGLNNLIWVWNAQNADWYPGDAYVDIVGEDIYANSYDYSSQSSKLAEVLEYPDTKKLTTLSENGVIMDPDQCIRDNAYWLYFNVWNGDFIIGADGKLNEAKTSTEQLIKTYNSDLVITLDELPSFE